jgi:hypothetical protein
MVEESANIIERHARDTVGTTVFDMFVYYAPQLHPASTIDRLNCAGLSEKLTEKIHSDKGLTDVRASIIPLDSDHYTPEQFAKYPYGHTAVLTEKDEHILGLVDPAYGIFVPLWVDGVTVGNGWEFSVDKNGTEHFLNGVKKDKNINWRFYPEKAMTADDRQLFQNMRLEFQRNAHSYLLSPIDAKKITRIEVDAQQIRYKNQVGIETAQKIDNDPQDLKIEELLETYVEEVNGLLVPQGRKLDFSEFYAGVTAFWNTVQALS